MIKKNQPKKYYESGYNEAKKENLFDSLVLTDFKNIFNAINDSKLVNKSLSLIIDRIDSETYSFDNFSKDETTRHSFITIFHNLMERNDFNNVCLFLEQPLINLVNFYNKEFEFSKYAINYLINYINSYKIKSTNLNSFCDHIKKTIEHCGVSEMNSDFHKLKDFLIYITQNIDKFCHKNLQPKINKFFNDIIKGNLNKNKDLKEEYHKLEILKDIVEYTGILCDMSVSKNQDEKNQHKLLVSIVGLFKKEFDIKKDKEILKSLNKNEYFCQRVKYLLNFYFKTKHFKNIDVMLNSLYSEFINFEDSELKKNARDYFKEAIKSKEVKDKKFIHHLKLIDKKFRFSKIDNRG